MRGVEVWGWSGGRWYSAGNCTANARPRMTLGSRPCRMSECEDGKPQGPGALPRGGVKARCRARWSFIIYIDTGGRHVSPQGRHSTNGCERRPATTLTIPATSPGTATCQFIIHSHDSRGQSSICHSDPPSSSTDALTSSVKPSMGFRPVATLSSIFIP